MLKRDRLTNNIFIIAFIYNNIKRAIFYNLITLY
jgi:hypothetical protein